MADVVDLRVVRASSRMPRSVKVGHRTFDILQWDKKAAEASGALGDCREDPPVIRVAKGLKPFDRAGVLLHEILHACWRHLPSDRVTEEEAVTTLADNLSAVIADNPDIIAWLSANLKRS
jgi:hypothetical protein